jgi:hypothetical protein
MTTDNHPVGSPEDCVPNQRINKEKNGKWIKRFKYHNAPCLVYTYYPSDLFSEHANTQSARKEKHLLNALGKKSFRQLYLSFHFKANLKTISKYSGT